MSTFNKQRMSSCKRVKGLKVLAATLAMGGLCLGTVIQAHAQGQDTLAKVKASGVITMGVRDSSGALSYTLGGGQYAGFHVDVCRRIIAAVEKAVGRKVQTQYVAVTSANRIPLVQNGTVDLECGTTTNNAMRQKEVAFLNTLYVEEVRMAVKAHSGIHSIAQLNGRSVVTTAGTTSVQTLRKHERSKGVEFKELFGKDHADSFLLLESGRADAFVMDASILAGNVAMARNPADFRIVGEALSVEPIAIMVRKDDGALRQMGNQVIAGLVKSGEINRLWDKWFLQPIPPKNMRIGLAASALTKAAWANLNDKPMEDYANKK